MIKKYLPFENLTYNSPLKKDQLMALLSNEIEEERPSGFGSFGRSYSKPYVGTVRGNTFNIKRAITYRNSFLPEIKVEINATGTGSKVQLGMRLNTFVKAFMLFWLGGVLFACFGSLYYLFFVNGLPSERRYFVIIPFSMLLFGLALVSIGFKTESKKSILDLERILKLK